MISITASSTFTIPTSIHTSMWICFNRTTGEHIIFSSRQDARDYRNSDSNLTAPRQFSGRVRS